VKCFSGASHEPLLVFGGSGFLGNRVCAAFSDAGYHVLSVSRSGARSPLWRTGARTEIESVAVDLSAVSVAGLGRIFEKAQPDVVNAAAAVWRATEQSMRALHMRQHARHPAPQRLRTPVRYHRRRGDLHPRPLPGRLPASTSHHDHQQRTSRQRQHRRHGQQRRPHLFGRGHENFVSFDAAP
jgi:hypothetical protein